MKSVSFSHHSYISKMKKKSSRSLSPQVAPLQNSNSPYSGPAVLPIDTPPTKSIPSRPRKRSESFSGVMETPKRSRKVSPDVSKFFLLDLF